MSDWEFPFDVQSYAKSKDGDADIYNDCLEVRYSGGNGYYDHSTAVILPLAVITELLRRAGWKVEPPK